MGLEVMTKGQTLAMETIVRTVCAVFFIAIFLSNAALGDDWEELERKAAKGN